MSQARSTSPLDAKNDRPLRSIVQVARSVKRAVEWKRGIMSNQRSKAERMVCHLAYLLRRLLDRYCPPPPPLQLPERVPGSFLPGQVCVLARLPADPNRELQPVDTVRRIERVLQPLLEEQPARIDPQRLVLLRGPDQTLAAVFVFLPRLRYDPRGLLGLVNRLNRRIRDRRPNQPPTTRPRRASDPTELGSDSTQDGGSTTQPPDNLELLAGSPNWLCSSSQQVGTTGGPGARPVRVSAPQVSAADTTPPWVYTIPPGMLASDPGTQASRPVTVAILDTLPPVADLQQAHQHWVSDVPDGQRHPLLELLCGTNTFALGPDQRLEVTPASINLLTAVDVDLLDHRYVMADHGLFAAGIIGSIVPEAHLQLIEVLNPYGVGSLESLLLGLNVVAGYKQANPSTAVVVNCSLMLNCPPPDQQAIWRQGQQTPDVLSLTPEQIEQSMTPLLGLVLEFLGGLGVADDLAIVAAAGNDGAADYLYPPPRYPAAYQHVTGVAALDASGAPAIYSNKSDKPLQEGLAVFGGSVANPAATVPDADPNGGVLGVYIGATPDKFPNESGWARWAGTSFAAPVISAVLARRMTNPNETVVSARAAINPAVPPGPLGTLGELFSVKQGG